MTGSAPYEEIVSAITCPEALHRDICALWQSDQRYQPIVEALASEDELFEEEARLATDTVYRILVLFGAPETQLPGPVAEAIEGYLSGKEGAKVFAKDTKKASLSKGSIPELKRARKMLAGPFVSQPCRYPLGFVSDLVLCFGSQRFLAVRSCSGVVWSGVERSESLWRRS